MPGNINFSKFWAFVGRSVPPLSYKQKPLTNLRHFEKNRQYIGAECTRPGAVFLESCDL